MYVILSVTHHSNVSSGDLLPLTMALIDSHTEVGVIDPVLRSALWLVFDVVCWIWMGLNPKHLKWRADLSGIYCVWIELLTNPRPETRLSLERLFWQSVIQFLRVKGLPACIAALIHCTITVVRVLIGCLLSVFIGYFYYSFVIIVLVILGFWC